MSGPKKWWERPIVEWSSVAAAISMGPLFIIVLNQLGLVYLAGFFFYILVWVLVVPVIVRLGGRFGYLDWQLAAVSLAVTVFVKNLRVETCPTPTVWKLGAVGLGFWLASSVLSSPLPLARFVESRRERRRRVAAARSATTGPNSEAKIPG
jgi:hypothetical protein